jgi:hypothetical protein
MRYFEFFFFVMRFQNTMCSPHWLISRALQPGMASGCDIGRVVKGADIPSGVTWTFKRKGWSFVVVQFEKCGFPDPSPTSEGLSERQLASLQVPLLHRLPPTQPGHHGLSARVIQEGLHFKNTHQHASFGFVSTKSRRARMAPRGRWTGADE